MKKVSIIVGLVLVTIVVLFAVYRDKNITIKIPGVRVGTSDSGGRDDSAAEGSTEDPASESPVDIGGLLASTPITVATIKAPDGAVARGFFYKDDILVTMASPQGSNNGSYEVVWINENNSEVRSVAEFVFVCSNAPEVIALRITGESSRFPKIPIRKAASLVVGEAVVRFLGESDQAPGTIVQVPHRMHFVWGLQSYFTTTDITDGGDSGSPVIEEDGRVVGMVIGGSESGSIVVPIDRIKESLLRLSF